MCFNLRCRLPLHLIRPVITFSALLRLQYATIKKGIRGLGGVNQIYHFAKTFEIYSSSMGWEGSTKF
jgi:hypothetical protein